MQYRPKHILEYLALRLVAAAIRGVPYRPALAIGGAVAWLSFHLGRRRVREAMTRIRQVFGDRYSPAQARKIAWISWRNFVFGAVEMIRVDKFTLEQLQAMNPESDIATLKKHSDTGQGAVAAVAHMGSWELAALTCHRHGIPVFTLAAHQKNPLTDRYLFQLRQSPGIQTVARGSGTMRDVLRLLLAGKMLAILPDVRMRTPEIKVPFLGGEANVGKGMALFARHAKVPILLCIVKRHGWTRHKITVAEPIWPDYQLSKEDDIQRMTTIVLRRIDDAIHETPEQWFWYNKRWILDPVQ